MSPDTIGTSAAFMPRKNPMNESLGIGEPLPPFRLVAGHNHPEDTAMKIPHSAKLENTFLPNQLQRISKHFGFTLLNRVRGIEDDC